MASTMRLDPEAIAGATFSAARRGYDPDEVRPFLRAVSDELERLRAEVDELRAQLAHRTAPMVDEAAVAAALGEEAVRVLTTARDGAAQIRARAEESAAELVRDANEDALRLRREADLDAAHRRQQAASEADAAVESAKTEGREMVAEARAVRERMLDDLARRRERARSQFEQLRQSYERVLRSFEGSAGALSAITEDLRSIGPEVGANATTLESTGDTGPVALIAGDVVGTALGAHVAAAAPEEPAAAYEPQELAEVTPAADVQGGVVVELPVPEHEPAEVPNGALAPVVQIVVPRRAEPVVERAAEVAVEADPDPDVVVTAMVLGELDDDMLRAHERAAAAADVADVDVVIDADADAAGDADADIVTDGDAEPGIDEHAEPDALDTTDVEAVDTVEVSDASDVAEPAEEPAAHRALPPTSDLFARIRASREQLAVEAAAAVAAAKHSPSEAAVEAGDGTGEAAEPTITASVEAAPAPATVDHTSTGPASQAAAPDAAAAVAARAEALAPIHEAMARRLKRVLADEQNEVLDRLRRAKVVVTLDELVRSAGDHAASYQSAIEGDAWAALVAGARSLAPTNGDGDGDDALAGRADLAAAVAAELAAELVEPFRQRLAATLEAYEPAEAAEVLRAVYRDWKTQRIDAVSEHLARFAFGRGAFAALVPGTAVRWAVDPTGPGCPDGEDNALGGAVACGTEFPTGHTCAPAYTGCRCILLPDTAG